MFCSFVYGLSDWFRTQTYCSDYSLSLHLKGAERESLGHGVSPLTVRDGAFPAQLSLDPASQCPEGCSSCQNHFSLSTHGRWFWRTPGPWEGTWGVWRGWCPKKHVLDFRLQKAAVSTGIVIACSLRHPLSPGGSSLKIATWLEHGSKHELSLL
jgi:hypothetical protein